MVFQRTVRREFAQTAAGIFVALFAVMISIQAIRLLGDAASGRVSSEAVLALLGFSALNYSAYLLSLTLFVSVLMSLSRSYRDSEMVVWFSSGVSLTAWIRPVLIFAFPLVVGIAVLTLVATPWSHRMSAEFRQKMQVRSDASLVAPGSFKEASSTDRVVLKPLARIRPSSEMCSSALCSRASWVSPWPPRAIRRRWRMVIVSWCWKRGDATR
jgi:lipopolysaccharide export system permease protein